MSSPSDKSTTDDAYTDATHSSTLSEKALAGNNDGPIVDHCPRAAYQPPGNLTADGNNLRVLPLRPTQTQQQLERENARVVPVAEDNRVRVVADRPHGLDANRSGLGGGQHLELQRIGGRRFVRAFFTATCTRATVTQRQERVPTDLPITPVNLELPLVHDLQAGRVRHRHGAHSDFTENHHLSPDSRDALIRMSIPRSSAVDVHDGRGRKAVEVGRGSMAVRANVLAVNQLAQFEIGQFLGQRDRIQRITRRPEDGTDLFLARP